MNLNSGRYGPALGPAFYTEIDLERSALANSTALEGARGHGGAQCLRRPKKVPELLLLSVSKRTHR